MVIGDSIHDSRFTIHDSRFTIHDLTIHDLTIQHFHASTLQLLQLFNLPTMLALHIDNLLFLLLIGMAALLRLLASKAGAAKKTSQQPEQRSTPPPLNQPIARAPEETDADRIRKF